MVLLYGGCLMNAKPKLMSFSGRNKCSYVKFYRSKFKYISGIIKIYKDHPNENNQRLFM